MTLNIVIGIPTFQRPKGLKRLLDSIAKQVAPFTPHVLVADNEGEGGIGLTIVEKVKRNGFPFPLTGIAVSERGISQVRNALMDAAFGGLNADVLAMVDDDERVEPGWIVALANMQEKGGFDVVSGVVMPEFEGGPPKWTKGQQTYFSKKFPPGPVSIIYGTGNVILHRSVYDKFPSIKFRPEFSLSGGGDKEFFVHLKKMGASFGFAPEAISYEFFGGTRLTKRWAIQRAFRIGCGDARIFALHLCSPVSWLFEIGKILTTLILSPFILFALIWSTTGRMRVFLSLARQAGKIKGLFGTPPKVYEKIHGE